MNTPQFKTGQRVFDPLDTYVYLTITGMDHGNQIDSEPIYKVDIFAKNTGRFIIKSKIKESRLKNIS